MATATDAPAASPLRTEAAAAEYLSLQPGTLAHWRSTGPYNLPYHKVGRHVRYHIDDLNRWLDSRKRGEAPSEDESSC